MRISDWSSDVCSSDLPRVEICPGTEQHTLRTRVQELSSRFQEDEAKTARVRLWDACGAHTQTATLRAFPCVTREHGPLARSRILAMRAWLNYKTSSKEPKYEIQSLIRSWYAVLCLIQK